MANTDRGANRRVAPRRPVVFFVWYKVIEPEIGDGGDGIAQVFDLSKQGVGIYTTQSLPLAARVFLELATQSGHISLVGRIRHCKEARQGYFRVGIEVEIVPPNDRAALARLVSD